jgi:hypothetical protein
MSLTRMPYWHRVRSRLLVRRGFWVDDLPYRQAKCWMMAATRRDMFYVVSIASDLSLTSIMLLSGVTFASHARSLFLKTSIS